MSFVTETPTNPEIALTITPMPAAPTGPGFRTALNGQIADLLARVQRTDAFLEKLTERIGNGAVSGGTISIGTSLSVNVAALAAIIGNIVEFNASQVVGGFTDATTNYLFLRQDGSWHIPAAGASTPPTLADNHGQWLLWGTVTCAGGVVTAVTNVRRSFDQQLSHIAIVASDPASAILEDGDLWYNSGSNELKVRVGGNTKLVGLT